MQDPQVDMQLKYLLHLAFQGGLDSQVFSSVLCSKPAFVVILCS
jgi:hypothetical protein